MTTQLYHTAQDIAIADWQGAGLLAPSVVRTHKLATLEKVLIRRRIGRLRSADRRRVASVIRQTFIRW